MKAWLLDLKLEYTLIDFSAYCRIIQKLGEGFSLHLRKRFAIYFWTKSNYNLTFHKAYCC
ncbi:hypothetical protein OC25_05430 [Pedobacter kyungheensis]|uniref:Uncharacterized protein n=1 Tax=Pedobacter kyungheensis TaxID=1069985 RepID=A0A0C1FSS2_9SPHI|nr:hypothetical protein OC25_05430 [Pedobacter kyungheensis]